MKHKKILREFWDENYKTDAYCPSIQKRVGGFCKLCANTGIIDTTKSAVTAFGEHIGGKVHCICPNGRHLKQDETND